MIEINDLNVLYRRRKIIKNSSLKINEPGIIGLIGPNGSGKTTLKKSIMGLIKKKGNIVVDELTYNSRQEYLDKLFFIESNDGLYSDLNVLNHLKYIQTVYKSNVDLESLVQDLDMDYYKKMPVKKMSLGMKQKLLVSMSVMSDASNILLDEPFNGLDLINSRLIADYLVSLKSSKVIIISSHDIVHMKSICNQFIFIKDQQLVTIDNTKDIDLEKLYYEYYA